MTFFPGVGGALAGAFIGQNRQFELVGTNSGLGATINISAVGLLRAGDVCICVNSAFGDTTVSSVVPSGFTDVLDVGDGNFFLKQYWRGIFSVKLLNGTESTVTGMNNDFENWIIAVLRPPQVFTSMAINSVDTDVKMEGTRVVNVSSVGGTPGACITVGAHMSKGSSSLSSDVTHTAHSYESTNSYCYMRFRGWDTQETILSTAFTAIPTSTYNGVACCRLDLS